MSLSGRCSSLLRFPKADDETKGTLKRLAHHLQCSPKLLEHSQPPFLTVGSLQSTTQFACLITSRQAVQRVHTMRVGQRG